MQGKYECTYGAIYVYVYLCIQLYKCLEMHTYVYLYTMCSYIYLRIHQYCLTILAKARHGQIRLGRAAG